MKRLLLTLVLSVSLAGCAGPGLFPGPTKPVVIVAPLVPPAMRAQIIALVAKYPQAKPFLVSVANGLTAVANLDGQLPDPNGTLASLVSWCALIPQVGSYVSDFMVIYRASYPGLNKSGAVLAEIAEIVRSGTTAP